MNAFDDWMERVGLRQIDVADALGISPSGIDRYRRGGFWPTRAVAVRIKRFTAGEVVPNDLLDDGIPIESTEEYRLGQKAILAARERRKRKRNGSAAKGSLL